MSRSKDYQRLLNSPQWGIVKGIVKKRANGLCERCKAEGRITVGIDCHHIKPVEGAKTLYGPDGMIARCYDVDNIQLLCIACHIKTHQEMMSHKKEQVKANKDRELQRWIETHQPKAGKESQ